MIFTNNKKFINIVRNIMIMVMKIIQDIREEKIQEVL